MQSPAARVAAWLEQLDGNRRACLDWMHPSWLPAWLLDGTVGESLRDADDACANALVQLLELPSVDAFDTYATWQTCASRDAWARNVLAFATLPIDWQRRLLRLRALVFRRGEVRRIVDLMRRSRLAALLGEQATPLLRWLAQLPGAPDVATLSRAIGMPGLDALDDDALEWEGFCLLERDGVLANDAAAQWLRRALPRELDVPIWLARCERAVDADGSAHVLSRLPELFPEPAWSFGCDIPTSN
ncbi:type III secretion protein HrpB4 [Trinickia fusca]|nr:type III secretion protein HrpB4 [Trinickia fusca]